ncbi:patatin-like phospholipase family protein [Edaphobacter paludis]|uniref:Patatin-like phospholipase family protein n=1 Tax=Edaphobacter paludis TaxID=3035702 RepID=A0AAU7CUV4_9BACT
MASFKIGISMAGAISAGAYTAGVLDFLTEALDAWEKAKDNNEAVLRHDVCIEVLAGASAGGMCAAIATVMLQEDFEHIHDTSKRGTSNRFYESWVNLIDIEELLKTDDIKKRRSIVSLLDSAIVSTIAEYALTPKVPRPTPRRYVSPHLTLFLSLTNLGGIPYSLNSAAPGSIEETTFFYGDRIRFETTHTRPTSLVENTVRKLDLTTQGKAGGWDVLQTAAMATGAFPVFLAPRLLDRYVSEYLPPHWLSVTSAATGTPPPVPPNFPKNFSQPFLTLNADGGVTNNDPFNYAHDYLASLDPVPEDGHDQQKPLEADRSVISIAPFPTTGQFKPIPNAEAKFSIFSILSELFSALVSQSRFFGESLSEIMTGTTFSRFVIAPSDDELAKRYLAAGSPQDQPPALQCATLGAFGGFLEREFRAHDYALGRRNCQKFLSTSFVLPEKNAIIAEGLAALDPAARKAVYKRFKRPAPGTYAHTAEMLQWAAIPLPADQQQGGDTWFPIIPLCTDSLREKLPRVKRAAISHNRVQLIVTLILKRSKEVISRLIDLVPSRVFQWFLRFGQPFIRWLARRPLTETLIKQLGDSYQR